MVEGAMKEQSMVAHIKLCLLLYEASSVLQETWAHPWLGDSPFWLTREVVASGPFLASMGVFFANMKS